MMDYAAQHELETLFHKNQLLPRLRAEFDQPFFVQAAEDHQIPVNFVLDLLSQMVLHRRALPETLVGILCHHFKSYDNPEQTCADVLMICVMLGLVEFHEQDRPNGRFGIKWDVRQEVHQELEQYQYPMPMIVEPRTVHNNRDCGYLTQTFGSIMLGGNHTEDDVCLDHINRLNKTRYTINVDTVRLIQNKWNNLDKPKDGESLDDFAKRRRAFQKYDQAAREVIEHLITSGNQLWLTHRYDHRGRTYAQGYSVNPQGNAWQKAILEFADKEVLEGFEVAKQAA